MALDIVVQISLKDGRKNDSEVLHFTVMSEMQITLTQIFELYYKA